MEGYKMKKMMFMLLFGFLLVGCSNVDEEKGSTNTNQDEPIVENTEDDAQDEGEDLAKDEEEATNESQGDTEEEEGEDLSNAEKTTNENGDDVYVFPMGKEGKIKEWMHQYSAIVEVNDFSISDTLPESVTGIEDEKADDDEMFAIMDVTFKNDGKHADYVEDDTSTTNIAQAFLIRPDLERQEEDNAINDGGNIPYIDGEIDTVSLDPGDEQQVYIVFPIGKEFANEEQYYLTYQAYGDKIYAWELKK